MKIAEIRKNWLSILITAIIIIIIFVPNFTNFARYKIEEIFGKFNSFVGVNEISIAQGQDVIDFYLDPDIDDSIKYDELSNTYLLPLPPNYINNKEDLYLQLHGLANGYGKVILLEDNKVINDNVKLEYEDSSFWDDYYACHDFRADWYEKTIQLNKIHEYTLIFGKETESVKIKFVNEKSL